MLRSWIHALFGCAKLLKCFSCWSLKGLIDSFISRPLQGVVVAKNNNKTWPLPSGQPLLLIPCREERFTWMMYNVVDNKFLDQQVSLPNKRFCGSSKGWLIAVEKDWRVTLINPFQRFKGSNKKDSIIYLPPLYVHEEQKGYYLKHRHYNYYVNKATITSDPILSPKDCTVVVIYGDTTRVAILRLGGDRTWTYVEDWICIAEVVSVDQDKLYAISAADELLSFDVNTGYASMIAPKLVDHNPLWIGHYFCYKKYLVYSVEKELLMVHRYVRATLEDTTYETLKFKIFRMSFEKCEWIEKETLGDVVLFLGDNSTVSVLASDIEGCIPNCIYFNQDHDDVNMNPKTFSDFGVYKVDNRTVSKPYDTDVRDMVEMAKFPSIWV